MRYRRLPAIVSLLVLFSQALFGYEADAPLRQLQPIVMAQGGSYTAIARGYNSLFTNPAGFAHPAGELTLLSATMWLHSDPFAVPAGLQSVLTGEAGGRSDRIGHQFRSGGFGIGGASGIGYTGNNVGIGVSAVFDSFFGGDRFPSADTLGTVSGVLVSEISIVGGIAVPFPLGNTRVSIGADLRPFARAWSLVDSPAQSAGLIARYLGIDVPGADEDFMNNIPVLNGFGLAFDAGALVEWDELTLGLTVRDIGGTGLNYSRHSLERVWSDLQSGGIPVAARPGDIEYVDEDYYIPTTVSVGAAYRPLAGGFGRRLNPVVHVEVRDLLRVADHEQAAGALLHLHAGLEATLRDTLAIRAGLYQGHPTLGFGISLGFFEINAAWFTREMGAYPGDRPARGTSLEAALRF